jgi:spore maturation protein CgeB
VNPTVAVFCHSLVSDWNHGNAHFLRGVVAELQSRGCTVRVFEPENAWSRENLVRDHGEEAVHAFQRTFPSLKSTRYSLGDLRLDERLSGVDLAIVHEWNDPRLISSLGEYRRRQPGLRLFLHDTHHRALTASEEIARFDLSEYDGVLAYGASLRDVYQRQGWGSQVHVWHEAADTRVFYPRFCETKSGDVVWIGNWGDEERSQELREFFINPVKEAGLRAQAYGVRYPESARQELEHASIEFGGWLPNFQVPEVFASFRATVHVPRRPYTEHLPGIPTIRPFEALACGIPLVSAPWRDEESLFRIGTDFLMAANGKQMGAYLDDILHNENLARSLSQHGLQTIRARHTCAHRVDELLEIYGRVKPARQQPANLLVSSEACS